MLGRAFHIVTIADIPIRVHWTFGFFFLWIAYVGRQTGMDMTGVLWFSLFAIVLFVCVVMHEYGHALTARRFGVKTKDIIISPIGGIARLLTMPKKPSEELKIAIAGPLVNLLIALVLGIGLYFLSPRGIFPAVGDPAKVFNDPANFLPMLLVLNMALIVFNLIPAFPMDGGRILRALLSMRWSRTTATRIASLLGQLLAGAFLVIGVWRGDFVLAFIGVFVFFSAANEFRMVQAEALMSDNRVSDVYRSKFTPLYLSDRMGKVIALLETGQERDFLVIDDWGGIQGVMHEEFIREAAKNNDHQASVQQYISPQFEYVDSSLSLKQLYKLFQKKGYSIIPVHQIGQMIGVVDRQALNNYLRRNTGLWKNWTR